MVTFNMKKLMVTVLAALNLLFVADLTVESVQAAEAKQAAAEASQASRHFGNNAVGMA